MKDTYLVHAERIVARCREIAACTEVPGETTRLFLTPSMQRVHALLSGWMEAAGMAVHIDAAGNLRGVLGGEIEGLPRLIIGSHLDTVPNAGAFDGILGVVLGVSLVEAIVESYRSSNAEARGGRRLPFAIEVVGFSEEEGVRFGKPFLGSLAVIGQLDGEMLALTDAEGISVADAIRAYGLDPARIPAAASEKAFAYLEFHIEQGPVLESENAPLAAIAAIAGQTRMQLVFTGQANHAGTIPMHLRHDAMAAAASWIVSVEDYASSHPGLVATVGKIESLPGAGNVIAGRVTASLDVRHAQDEIREAAVATLLEVAGAAAKRRGVRVEAHRNMDQPAVHMDPRLTSMLQQATSRAGFPARTMTSGAGHDAMIIARRIPATMLFLRCPGGLSHHPDETVLPEDVAAALASGVEFLAILRDDKTIPKERHA